MEVTSLDLQRAFERRLGGYIAIPLTTVMTTIWIFLSLGFAQTFKQIDQLTNNTSSSRWRIPWYNKQLFTQKANNSNFSFNPRTNLHLQLHLLQYLTVSFALISSISDIISRLGTYKLSVQYDLDVCSFLAQSFVVGYSLGKLCSFRFFATKMFLMLNEVSAEQTRSRIYTILTIVTSFMICLVGVVAWLSTGVVNGTGTCTYFVTQKNPKAAFAVVGGYTVCEVFMNGVLLYMFIKPLLSSASFSKRLKEIARYNLIFGSLTIILTFLCMVLLSYFVIAGPIVAVGGTTITNFDSFINTVFQMFSLSRSWTFEISKSEPARVKLSADNSASSPKSKNLFITSKSKNEVEMNSVKIGRPTGRQTYEDSSIQPFIEQE
jgi:hypothetical protein